MCLQACFEFIIFYVKEEVLELSFEEILELIKQAISLVLSRAEEENLRGFEFYEEVFNAVYEYILERLSGAKVIVFKDGGMKVIFRSVEEFILFLQSLFSLRQILSMAGKKTKAGRRKDFANLFK